MSVLAVFGISLRSAEYQHIHIYTQPRIYTCECVGLPSVDALGTEDYACNSTHNSVSDRVCTPKATVVGYMGGVGNYPSYETNYSKLNYTETIRLQYDPTILSFSKVDYINFFPAVLEEILTTRSWKHIGN